MRVIRTIQERVRMIRLSPDDPDGGPDVRPGSNSRSVFFFSFLPSSLPCFPRGWCRCSLALALLLVRSIPTIPMHAHERGVKYYTILEGVNRCNIPNFQFGMLYIRSSLHIIFYCIFGLILEILRNSRTHRESWGFRYFHI